MDQRKLHIHWFILTVYKTSGDETIKKMIEKWEPEIWLLFDEASVPTELKNLPSYKTAQTIKNSPLYNAIKEEE